MIDIYPTIVEINDLSAAVVWTTVPDAYISASSVNQHVTLEKATQTKTYTNGETSAITLSQAITSGAPVVSVIKEIPQTGATNNDWDAAAASYTLENSAPATTLSFPTFAGNDVTSAFGTPVIEDVSSETTTPTGVFLKADGSKMYVVSNGTDGDIYQYALSTAFDTTSATLEKTLDITGWGQALSIFFKPDGTRLFIGSTTHVAQFDLTTAWDVSTASAVSAVNVAPYTTATGLYFKPDGSSFYFTGTTSSAYIWKFACGTAWTISGSYYVAGKALASAGISNGTPRGLWFASDGSTAYLAQTDNVKQFSLSSAWTLSTLSSNPSTSETLTTGLYGLFYTDDFQYLFTANNTSNNITSYSFAPASAALGTGSFASTDVGKTINVNDGALVLTATDGSFSINTAPTSYNTAASGSWSMNAVVYDAAADVLEVSAYLQGYSLANASYDSVSLDVSSQETDSQYIAFNSNGTKLFVTGRTGDDVNEYTLSTAYDISTASYSQNFSVASQDGNPRGIAFNSDGTKMFIVGGTGVDVNEYTLSAGFDVSTASFVDSFSVNAQDTAPEGIAFNSDGTKMFVTGRTGDTVIYYSLSTGFDVSTSSHAGNFSVASQDTTPMGIAFSADGTVMFISGTANDSIYQYVLTTGFDISTASYDSSSIDVSSQVPDPKGIAFNGDGKKLFILSNDNNTIYQYSTVSATYPTGYQPCISSNIDTTYWTDINSLAATNAVGDGNVFYAVSNDNKTAWSVLDNTSGTRDIVRNNSGTWQYNNAVVTQGGSLDNGAYVSTGTISGQDISDFMWRSNGTILFLLDNTGDSVRKYTASTAYDMSTLSLSQSFSVASQEIYLTGMYISEDGLHLYVCGSQGNDVNEYTLTSAFDLTTASFTRSGISSTNIGGIYFSADGTKLYRTSFSQASIWYWSLSTAWDISSATFVSAPTLPTKSTGCTAITFNSDGTLLFVDDNTDDKIYSYTLSTGWDISTIAYSEQLSFASQASTVGAIDFNADLTIMYIGTGADFYKYTTSVDTYTTNENWVNATVNNEVQALRDSMSISINQMDSTKLNAITDANQITLGNDLDFAAILYFASGSTAPTYSGTAVNYDANVINQGAVLGTDYNWDFPSSTSVRLTSLGDYNLKVRII
jgi:sugar lactone lactonase YvrE